MQMTSNHRSERTAKLHHAFNTMDRKSALAYGIKELGYTASGASSWFSDWDKLKKSGNAPAVATVDVVSSVPVTVPVVEAAPPAKDKAPWEKLGISKSTYYKRKKKGSLEFMD